MMTTQHAGRTCATCFFTDTFPGVTIEDNGRCNYCNRGHIRTKIRELTTSNLEQLQLVATQLKLETQQKGAKYDCIVGASGGLDSSYVIYVARRIMGLNPLVVSYANDFTTSIARENLQRLCKVLGVDLRTISSKGKFDRKHIAS